MSYACGKCGARLDPGERCKCGGRAVYMGQYRSRSFHSKKTPPNSPMESRMVYEIYKIGGDSVLREYTDFNKALKECASDEYIRQVMLVKRKVAL